MTCRKAKTILYRIFALVAVVTVAVFSWITLSFLFAGKAYADETQSEHDNVFGTDHARATELSSAVKELPSGSYYLTDDVVLTAAIEMFQQEDVKLCLHGHSVSASGKNIFRVFGASKLSIYDCGGEDHCGSISGGNGVYLFNGATLNLYGGAIKDGSGLSCGVSVSGNSVFNMYGGSITDNNSSNGGGGVHIGSNGTFNMYGGVISNNTTTALYGGAGVLVSDATAAFHMYGGTITNNVINTERASSEEALELFYQGAGVYVNAGVFSVEGDVNISGNIRESGNSVTINNVELDGSGNYDCKIDITGKLGENARIGVTAPIGEFTRGYFSAGNTENPSKYFICDSGSSIGFDDMRKECAVTDDGDDGNYDLEEANVTGSSSATVGDTEVTLTVELTLKNTENDSHKTISDVVKLALESPLHGGKNPVSFEYTYNGVSGEQTRDLTYEVVPKKLHVNVTWACSGATSDGRNSAKRNYDGNDFFGSVKASYTGYDGEQKSVNGSWTSNDILVTDEEGNSVSSTAGVGVYQFYLAPSADYEFDNNLFTVTLVGTEDDGYYQMQNATAIGGMGSPTVGDKKITVIVERNLKHTKGQPDKTDRVNYTVTLSTALHVGENTVEFEYQYTDMAGGVQTKALSVTVTAAKKSVTVAWYFYDSVAAGNAAKHVYDGVDASGKIVAEYDGIDGTKQRIDGASALMVKKDKDGNPVSSLSEVGVYRLYLAVSADYVFENNSFTYTVVENLSEITDLVYQESGKTVLGVSCDGGFESGTELAVERTECSPNVVDGTINSALSVKFVKDSVEITPTGSVTVHMLVPDELRNGATYKIYNLSGGIATPMKFTTEGNYAIFDTDELSCILFVTEQSAPPVDNPVDEPDHTGENPSPDVKPDDSGLIWLWILLPILVVGIAVTTVLLIIKSKHRKNPAASETAEPKQEGESEE